MASKAPTVFSEGTVGRSKMASVMTSQTDDTSLSGYRYKSEYEALFWAFVTKFTSSLTFFEEFKEKIEGSSLVMKHHSRIATVLKSSNQVEQTSLTCGNALLLLKERSFFLLSRKDVFERQLAISSRLIQEVKPGSALHSFAKQQPLDSESESRRRSFVATAVQIQSVIVNVSERVELMQSLRVSTDSAQLETKKAQRLLLFLKSIYDRTANLVADIDRLHKHVQVITPRIESDDPWRARTLTSAARRSHRKPSTPEQSEVKSAMQFKDVSKVVKNLRSSVTALSAPSVLFSRRSRFAREGRNAIHFRQYEDRSERIHVVSNLMTSPHQSTNKKKEYSALPSQALLSTENSSNPSQGAMSIFDSSSLSLSLPRSYTERLTSDVAESALSALVKTTAIVKVLEKNTKVNTRNEKMPVTEAKKKASAPMRFSMSGAEPPAPLHEEKLTRAPNQLANKLASPVLLSGFGEALPSINSSKFLGNETDTMTEEKRISPEKNTEAQVEIMPSASALPQEVLELKSSALADFSTIHPAPVLGSAVSEPNYREILTKFYEEHNISKIGDVDSNLAKYKVIFFLNGIHQTVLATNAINNLSLFVSILSN
jgi:hypothetical protein